MRKRLGQKVSLAMIVRNNEDTLHACLASAVPHVDEVVIVDTGSSDSTPEIAKSFGAKVIEREDLYDPEIQCVRDFSEARQISFDATLGDYILWLDSDDILVGGEQLPSLAEDLTILKHPGLMLRYNYARDENGEWTTVIYCRRFVERGAFRWHDRIHECLMPHWGRDCVHNPMIDVRVEHQGLHGSDIDRVMRNRVMLERAIAEEDPAWRYRHQAMLGRTHLAEEQDAKALECFRQALRWEGGDAQRFQLYLDVGFSSHRLGRQQDASEAYWAAHKIWPLDPRPYVGLAKVAMAREAWPNVLEYTNLAAGKKPTASMVPYNPYELQFGVFGLRQEALRQLDLHAQARGEAQDMHENHPSSPVVRDYLEKLDAEQRQKQAERALSMVLNSVSDEKVGRVVKCLPKPVRGNMAIRRRRAEIAGTQHREHELVFYLSNTGVSWSPEDLKHGAPGSESMLVRMANRMAKRGFVVRVYGGVEEPITTETAEWYPQDWFRDRKQFGTVIIWRDRPILAESWQADRVIYWAHDAMTAHHVNSLMIDRVNEWWFLSQWHRNLLPEVPEEKAHITRNGIRVDLHKAVRGMEKQPGLCVTASSPERALWVLLAAWPKVKEQVPHAELAVCYGFNRHWSKIEELPSIPLPGGPATNFGELRRDIEDTIDALPGVQLLGMIPEKDLIELMARAQVWAYPTKFGETSCITAMHAQAAGAIPVTCREGALPETVFAGELMDVPGDVWTQSAIDEYAGRLADTLRVPEHAQGLPMTVRREACRRFDIDALADQWAERIRAMPANQPFQRTTSEYWSPENRRELYREVVGASEFAARSDQTYRFGWLAEESKGVSSAVVLGAEGEALHMRAKTAVYVNANAEALAIARQFSEEAKNGTKSVFVEATIEEFCEEMASGGRSRVNLAIFFETIEHLDLPTARRVMSQIATFATRLLVTTPNFFGRYGIQSSVPSLRDGHVTLWTPEQFRLFLEEFGKVQAFVERDDLLHATVEFGG